MVKLVYLNRKTFNSNELGKMVKIEVLDGAKILRRLGFGSRYGV